VEPDRHEHHARRLRDGAQRTARNAGPNFLYRQEADGTFTEVGAKLAIDDVGWTLAVGSADLDNDGWPDLYSANDFGPDQLFLNRGGREFLNATDVSLGRDTKKGMNVDFGDFNNDGWIDMYVANITTAHYLHEGNMLWRNNGPGKDGRIRFMDVASEAEALDGGWGWGAKFLDYDHDGDLDIFGVNGFISGSKESYWYDLASWTVEDLDVSDSAAWPMLGERSFSGYERFRFWQNQGFEMFADVAPEIGIDSDRDGRGVVCFDYDNDGDLDLFVANQGQPAQLFRNSGPTGVHWLMVRLEVDPATGTNADAVGTRLTAISDDGLQIRERDGGNGYAGQSDPRVHFGLGSAEKLHLLEVRWPDGGLQYLENVAADRLITVRQTPATYAANARLAIEAPVPREAAEPPERRAPQIPPEVLERMLTEMEDGLRANPANHTRGFAYRRRCMEHEKHDRAIRFFQKLVDQNPTDRDTRLELAVAYVDKIPSRGGIAAVVSKGILARKSLDEMDRLLAESGDWWAAYYGRGMNHLHWPRALRHSDDAVADFRRCLELQRGKDGPEGPAHYIRTYILLGDALGKLGSHEEARTAWRQGLDLYPESGDLRERLELEGEDATLAFIESVRSLQNPIDTDFSFLDEGEGVGGPAPR